MRGLASLLTYRMILKQEASSHPRALAQPVVQEFRSLPMYCGCLWLVVVRGLGVACVDFDGVLSRPTSRAG